MSVSDSITSSIPFARSTPANRATVEEHLAPVQSVPLQQIIALGSEPEFRRIHAARNHVHPGGVHTRPLEEPALRVLADRDHGICALHEPRRKPALWRSPRLDAVHHEHKRNALRRGCRRRDRHQIDVAADHDIEALAKKGFLEKVDLTLMSGTTELRALRYDVDTDSGSLTTNRPGGVMWPRVEGADLRIVLYYTDDYTATEKETMRSKLRVSWTPTNVDTSHSTLSQLANRDYTSNAYGMRRKDFS